MKADVVGQRFGRLVVIKKQSTKKEIRRTQSSSGLLTAVSVGGS
jgi:hypothetical protein